MRSSARNHVALVRAHGRRLFVKLRIDERDDAAREIWALAQVGGLIARSHMRELVRAIPREVLLRYGFVGGGVVVSEAVAGRPRATLALDRAAIHAVARAFLGLHAVRPSDVDKPVIGGATAAAALAYARASLAQLQARALVSAAHASTIERTLTEQSRPAAHASSFARVLCHGDPRPANILFTSTRGTVAARFIDFEHAGLGDPALDLLRFSLRAGFLDDERDHAGARERALLDAYGDDAVRARYLDARPMFRLTSALASAGFAARAWRPTPARGARVVIAIDGVAGAGKTPIARGVARALGIAHVNTGAAYRAFALQGHARNIELDDAGGVRIDNVTIGTAVLELVDEDVAQYAREPAV
ncbi:MAG TPA: phosphotransferase, partial [Myxococcota bacterium]